MSLFTPQNAGYDAIASSRKFSPFQKTAWQRHEMSRFEQLINWVPALQTEG
jgi:hypothetical protein